MINEQHKGLVFDCDGTLADSMPVHWIAWEATVKHYGLDHLFPYDRFMALGGVPAKAILQTLTQEAGVTLDIDQAVRWKYERYYEHMDKITPIEAVLAIARQWRGKLPMAVATGSARPGVERTLAIIGASDWFDAVVSADDVTHSKPHPETFLRAAELIGVDPADCLAFEDADPGIASAQAAGMQVIDVRDLLAQGA